MNGLGQEDNWVEKEWTLAERFGANVVWFRRKAGLTQQELADRVGINRTALSKLERGGQVPRLHTILKLVAGLGVEVSMSLQVQKIDSIRWRIGARWTRLSGSSFRAGRTIVASSSPTAVAKPLPA